MHMYICVYIYHIAGKFGEHYIWQNGEKQYGCYNCIMLYYCQEFHLVNFTNHQNAKLKSSPKFSRYTVYMYVQLLAVGSATRPKSISFLLENSSRIRFSYWKPHTCVNEQRKHEWYGSNLLALSPCEYIHNGDSTSKLRGFDERTTWLQLPI